LLHFVSGDSFNGRIHTGNKMSLLGIVLQVYIYSVVISAMGMLANRMKLYYQCFIPVANTVLAVAFVVEIVFETLKSNKNGNKN
jgi:hypothetical protein